MRTNLRPQATKQSVPMSMTPTKKVTIPLRSPRHRHPMLAILLRINFIRRRISSLHLQQETLRLHTTRRTILRRLEPCRKLKLKPAITLLTQRLPLQIRMQEVGGQMKM